MNYLAYPWAILYGLYFYLLFHLVYILQFGSVNTAVSVLDLVIIFNGIVSVLMLLYFMRKGAFKKWLMFIPFVIAVPFAYIGTLGGGLIGVVAMVIAGLIPFVVLLPTGYWIIKKLAGSSPLPQQGGGMQQGM